MKKKISFYFRIFFPRERVFTADIFVTKYCSTTRSIPPVNIPILNINGVNVNCKLNIPVKSDIVDVLFNAIYADDIHMKSNKMDVKYTCIRNSFFLCP
jgi:hypothetical protein